MTGKHVRAAFDRRLEVRQRLFELSGQRNMDNRRHLMTEGGVRQARVIAADNTGFLESVEAARTGRLRQSDLFGERRVGNSAILLKSVQYRNIDPIEGHS